MHEWQSLSHVRWECKYHVVFIPKYRRKVLFGKLRRQIGAILRDVCRQKGVELVEDEWDRDPEAVELEDLLFVSFDGNTINKQQFLETIREEGFEPQFR